MTTYKAKEIISYHKILVDRDKSGLLDKELEYEAIDMAEKSLEKISKIEEILSRDCTDISKFAFIRGLFEEENEQ